MIVVAMVRVADTLDGNVGGPTIQASLEVEEN
jgi:hypothetical protein